MVLGNLPVPGRPTILITVGQGPIALAVGAAGDGLDIFTLIYAFSLSLGDGPMSQRAVKPKTTNQPTPTGYTQHTIFNIKKKITLKYPKYDNVCSYGCFPKH